MTDGAGQIARPHRSNKKRATVVPHDNWNFFPYSRPPTGQLEIFFPTVVPPRDNWKFFPYSRPPTGQLEFFPWTGWRKRGRVEASMPGSWGSHWQKKSVLQSSPHRRTGIFFLGRIPALARAWQEASICRAGGAAGWRLLCAAGTSRTLAVPRVLAIRAICAIWVSQGKPLNIHSFPGPCYMCYMCYMALYSTYTTDFRAYRII